MISKVFPVKRPALPTFKLYDMFMVICHRDISQPPVSLSLLKAFGALAHFGLFHEVRRETI